MVILDVQPLDLWQTFVAYEPPSLWSFIAAWTDRDHVLGQYDTDWGECVWRKQAHQMQMKVFPGKLNETTTAAVLAVGQGEGREGKV